MIHHFPCSYYLFFYLFQLIAFLIFLFLEIVNDSISYSACTTCTIVFCHRWSDLLRCRSSPSDGLYQSKPSHQIHRIICGQRAITLGVGFAGLVLWGGLSIHSFVSYLKLWLSLPLTLLNYAKYGILDLAKYGTSPHNQLLR